MRIYFDGFKLIGIGILILGILICVVAIQIDEWKRRKKKNRKK